MLNRSLIIGLILGASINLFGAKISQSECSTKGDDFIFAGGECIQYVEFKGDREGYVNIIVHGTWKAGTNTLGRYGPFAENVNMNTDVTTVAIALPGYSSSSTNNFEALAHEGVKNLSAKKEYIEFLGKLVKAFKDKYNANVVTYIGHSAGAAMGATLTGLEPSLINNIVLAGGSYKTDEKDSIKITNVMDSLDKKTKYVLIYGTADKISKPEVTTDFYKVAKANGLDVKLIKVDGAPHLDLDMTDPSLDAITELLE